METGYKRTIKTVKQATLRTKWVLVQEIRLADFEAHVAGDKLHDVLKAYPVHDKEAI